MKKVLLLTLVIMMCSSMAFAQGGWIQLAADPGGASCNIAALGVQMYMIHQASPGTTLSRYKIDTSNVTGGAVWLADNVSPYSAIGNTSTGISVAYGSCKVSPLPIGFTLYLALGTPAPCDYLEVVPDPAATSGGIESVDCTLPLPLKFAAGGSILTIDALGGSSCSPGCGQVVDRKSVV